MTTITFTKAHAAGADFVIVFDPDDEYDLDHAEIARLCDRSEGVGGLGVVRLVRETAQAPGAPEQGGASQDPLWYADVRRRDGAPLFAPEALRIAARYLIRHSLVPRGEDTQVTLRTSRGVVDVRRGASGFHTDLGRWRLSDAEALVSVAGLAVPRPGLVAALAGRTCAVIALADESELTSADLTSSPDISAAGEPVGAVCLVVPADPLVHDATGRIRVRTYDAGLGELTSGGIGAAVASLATRHWAQRSELSQWRATVPSGHVWARMFPAEDGEHVALSGPAELVFDGTIEL